MRTCGYLFGVRIFAWPPKRHCLLTLDKQLCVTSLGGILPSRCRHSGELRGGSEHDMAGAMASYRLQLPFLYGIAGQAAGKSSKRTRMLMFNRERH